MSEHNQNNLHKEFELERIILFSDAVFAIAITLLIIEIKFPELPENYKDSLNLFTLFQPTIVHLTGFLVSFLLIGMSWARHLSLFKYLKSYDNGLVGRNLLSLLFIVTFPFSAEGITHMRPSFMFPMIIYFGNIAAVYVTHFALAHYIFKQKPHLSIPGHEQEKKYVYETTKMTSIGLGLVFIVMLTVAIVSNFNNDYINYCTFLFFPVIIFVKRAAKKYKPKKVPVYSMEHLA